MALLPATVEGASEPQPPQKSVVITEAAKPPPIAATPGLAISPQQDGFQPRVALPPLPKETALRYTNPFKIAWPGEGMQLFDFPFVEGETVYQLKQNNSDFPLGYRRQTISISNIRPPVTGDGFDVDVKLVGEKRASGYIIGGHGLRSLRHATGAPCQMPKVEKPTELTTAETLRKSSENIKLPTVQCEYTLGDQKALVTLTATEVVPIMEDFNLYYLSAVTITQGSRTYRYSPKLPFTVQWAGDLNADGIIDFVVTEDTSHVSGASDTVKLIISRDAKDKDSDQLYEEVAQFRTLGC